MNQTTMWQDIAASVQRALREHLERLPDEALVQRSDALLARLPGVGGAPPTTTAIFLRRYFMPLRQELCAGTQPRTLPGTVEDELRDLTRSVLLTIGIGEGISVEAAVGLALVVYKRGVGAFCALPTLQPRTA